VKLAGASISRWTAILPPARAVPQTGEVLFQLVNVQWITALYLIARVPILPDGWHIEHPGKKTS
jgi:hypothetical protein